MLLIVFAPLNSSYKTSDFLSFETYYDEDLNERSKKYG